MDSTSPCTAVRSRVSTTGNMSAPCVIQQKMKFFFARHGSLSKLQSICRIEMTGQTMDPFGLSIAPIFLGLRL